MFKNRSFNVKMVKDNPKDWEDTLMSSGPGVTFSMSPEQLSNAASEFIEKNTETIVDGIITVLLVKTACDLARIFARRI